MKEIMGACRGCMEQVALHERRSDPQLTSMFIYCTRVKITDRDKLPQHFCAVCSNTIDSCFRFISKARKVDSTLRNSLAVVGRDSTDKSKKEYHNLCTIKEEPAEWNKFYEQNIKSESDGLDEKKEFEVNILPNPNFYGDTLDNDDFSENDKTITPLKTEKKKKKKRVTEKKDKHKHKHTKRSSTQCSLCNKVFTSKMWYERHVKTAHVDNVIRLKKYVCSICSKGFSRSDILTQHMVTHSDERPFPCHLCPNKYKMQKQLNCHLRMHRDQVAYKCDICGASFKWKAVLLNHIRSHEEKKQHLCDFCGAGFTQLGNLVQHKRTHSGEKPFACPHCPFRCSMSSSLRRHQRIHDGTKPHTCHTCGKCFRDYSSLLRHIRTHTGERPYRCMFCSQTFIDSGKRNRHVLRHHPIFAATDFSTAAMPPPIRVHAASTARKSQKPDEDDSGVDKMENQEHAIS